jgi:hypothetical protein
MEIFKARYIVHLGIYDYPLQGRSVMRRGATR